ncbi:MAG: FAD-dependent oxidoreductase, partial [Alphaproteobacteria bacterium]
AYGWDTKLPDFDWTKLIANKDKEIARLNGVYIKLLKESGVEIIEGYARVTEPHSVTVGKRRLTGKFLLIATGAKPVLAEIPGVENAITSNEAFQLKSLPKRIVISGGSYVALEFASLFRGLGSEVTLVVRSNAVLRGFDGDIRESTGEALKASGIKILTNAHVGRIERKGAALAVHTAEDEHIVADTMMFATGRGPNTGDLLMKETRIKLAANGAIVVTEYSQSSVPNIYAVGDVTNRRMLTPVAIAEAAAFVETVFNNKPTKVDYRYVPSAVFSIPPVATVGLSEADALNEYGAVDIYRSRFRPLKHTVTGRESRSLLKLVVDTRTDRILGCHMVGEDGPEIIQGLAIAMTCGARKADFDATIGLHPTAAEEFVTMREKVQAAAD